MKRVSTINSQEREEEEYCRLLPDEIIAHIITHIFPRMFYSENQESNYLEKRSQFMSALVSEYKNFNKQWRLVSKYMTEKVILPLYASIKQMIINDEEDTSQFRGLESLYSTSIEFSKLYHHLKLQRISFGDSLVRNIHGWSVGLECFVKFSETLTSLCIYGGMCMIGKDALSKLTNLHVLIIQEYHEAIPKELIHLERLSVSYSNDTLSEFEGSNLTQLSLSGGSMKNLNQAKTFKQFTNLKTLELKFVRMVHIMQILFSLPVLEAVTYYPLHILTEEDLFGTTGRGMVNTNTCLRDVMLYSSSDMKLCKKYLKPHFQGLCIQYYEV